jgi:AraC-like DNA-binding protein/mannose-6-phosphate isomerase-like protein (cupin superfamily)
VREQGGCSEPLAGRWAPALSRWHGSVYSRGMGLACTSVSQRRHSGSFEAHAHEHAQVLVGLRGHLELEVDGRAAFVDAACGLIVPAGARHAYDAPIPAQLLVLDAPPGRGLDRCRRFLPPPNWRTAPETLGAAQAIEQLLGAPRVLERRAIRLDELNDAIDAELHAAWSTERLAALSKLSAQRFHARFVELTGMTPMDHVRTRRLAVAQQRLKAGWPLETTALHVGYASASALAYALRRDLGVTSRALRRSERAPMDPGD